MIPGQRSKVGRPLMESRREAPVSVSLCPGMNMTVGAGRRIGEERGMSLWGKGAHIRRFRISIMRDCIGEGRILRGAAVHGTPSEVEWRALSPKS